MEWRIERDSDNQTVVYAAEELAKYLRKIDPAAETAILKTTASARFENTLRLKIGDDSGILPGVKDPKLDDAYGISVTNGVGVIAGSNERSVLLGVYRFLRELGCRWPRPGSDGEIIPQKDLAGDLRRASDSERRFPSGYAVRVSEKASYRHRGVCIEGSCSFEHVMNMVDWLPKAGMNSYFTQFSVPFTFFDHWYRHKNNPYMKAQPATIEEVTAMVSVIAEQIKKRGMLYHAAGHGWTCDPVGIPGNSWDKAEYNLTDDVRELLALVDGKREVYDGIALNTNLCYSNPKAREKIISAIVDYCRARKEVDYLHFWLADAPNNHCECENCKDTRPADFYVMMLNEIDKRLTTENIPTKIVFLIYFDLLWVPETGRLHNKERFTLMFAPITRTYTTSFYQENTLMPEEQKPFIRNKLDMPKTVGENIAYLKRWQKLFTGDGFDFDYHLIWDHNYDPGGFSSARILFEDMKNLDKLGLNGMMSCQVQRSFFPTGLAMNAMAAALWNKELKFEKVTEEFYGDIFGPCATEMSEYFRTLSELFQAPYMRGELPVISQECAKKFAEVPKLVNEMLPRLLERLEEEKNPFRKKTWFALTVHAQLCLYLSCALEERAKGNSDAAKEKWNITVDYINRMEPEIHELFDVKYFIDVIERVLKGNRLF